ncbi:hypothetical protein Mgra_00006923, partial [Meloidogyne graminicola]
MIIIMYNILFIFITLFVQTSEKIGIEFKECSETTNICTKADICPYFLICYDSMLTPNLTRNWKFPTRYSIPKRTKDGLCIECIYNGKCEGINEKWNGLKVKQYGNTLQIYADIFPINYVLELENINASEFIQFIYGEKNILNKIINSSPLDIEYLRESQNVVVPLLKDYPGLIMLKMDILYGTGIEHLDVRPRIIFNEECEKTTTTILPTTTKEKFCNLQSNPLDFNLYGCHCSSKWNTTDIDEHIREPVDEIDRCCMARNKCQLRTKQNCSDSEIFEIYEKPMNSSIYDFECVWTKKGAKMKCNGKTKCDIDMCLCDKKLIECLGKFPKPKKPQICWNLFLSISDKINGRNESENPLNIINSKKEEMNKSRNELNKIAKTKGKININNATDVLKEAKNSIGNNTQIAIDSFNKMEEQVKEADKNLENAIVKAERTNKSEDWIKVDEASTAATRAAVEAAILGRKIAENAQESAKTIDAMKEVENLIDKQEEEKISAIFAYPNCENIQKFEIANGHHGCLCCRTRHECYDKSYSYRECVLFNIYEKNCTSNLFNCSNFTSICQERLCNCDSDLNKCLSSSLIKTNLTCDINKANMTKINKLSNQAKEEVETQMSIARKAYKIAKPIIHKTKKATQQYIIEQAGKYVGGAGGVALGTTIAGPIGGVVGGFVGKQVGGYLAEIGGKFILKEGGIVDQVENTIKGWIG